MLDKLKTLLKTHGLKFLLAFGISWMITNGWAYIIFGLGLIFGNGIMLAIGGGYLTLIWLPFTPEKLLTLSLSILITKLL